MINDFKESVERDSGIVYKSQFQQIKKLYKQNPQLAGELAISAIELVITGSYSSDDFLIDLILTQNKVIVDKDKQQYEKVIDSKKQAQIEKLKLNEIAEMINQGMTQKKIAEKLGESERTISYRVGIIKNTYPHLLTKLTKITQITNYDNDNDNVNDNVDEDGNVIFCCDAPLGEQQYQPAFDF